MPDPDAIKKIILGLPEEPGVYLMKDGDGSIIYIGKASSLKKRVSSYFHKRDLDIKTRVLVNFIHDIEFIITDSEMEALILESSLIRKHKPRYNIQKKDDKRYPYIAVTLAEEYPRVVFTRTIRNDGTRYFGPYTDARAARNTVRLINNIFKLKICTLELPLKKNERPCMNFQINRCSGVCRGDLSRQEYRDIIGNAVRFLEGGIEPVIRNLQEMMQGYSGAKKYEKAAEIRDMIADIQKISESQKVSTAIGMDMDYVGVSRYGSEAVLILFEFRGGVLLGRKISIYENAEYAEPGEIIGTFILGYYENAEIPLRIVAEQAVPDRAIIQDFLTDKSGRKVIISGPETADDRGILRLIQKNIDIVAAERYADRSNRTALAGLEELAGLLGMEVPPRTMECFDISNLQGADAVASMVTFRDGVPDKSGYRRYKIRGYDSANDPGMIHEAVARRMQFLVNEERELPDLVVIDGGPTQLSRAREAARNFSGAIRIVSLAKQFEEIYTDPEKEPLRLPDTSPALRVLQNIRDEAHRFAVNYHRTLRSKKTTRSALDDLPVSEKTRKLLLAEFKSVDAVKKASLDELRGIRGIGDKTAEKIYNHFR